MLCHEVLAMTCHAMACHALLPAGLHAAPCHGMPRDACNVPQVLCALPISQVRAMTRHDNVDAAALAGCDASLLRSTQLTGGDVMPPQVVT